MRLTLKDEGYSSFKKIMQGRRWVGRVVRCQPGALGAFYSVVGQDSAYGATEREAFDRVCAKVFGFSSPRAWTRTTRQCDPGDAKPTEHWTRSGITLCGRTPAL